MDPVRLRLLRELGDRGSVVAVAAALHVSASAVSQQLAALQSTTPVPLTIKRGRTLVLTDAGEALARASIRVDEALAIAKDSIDSFLAAPERVVTVSAYHSAALTFFGPLLKTLNGKQSLSLADADVARTEFPSLTADFDLVIAHRLSHNPEWPMERVVSVPLLKEPLDIALPARHALAQQDEIHLELLRDEVWISTHEGFPLSGVLDHIGALIGGPPRIAHRINEFTVAAEVVRAGAAIAVMPRFTARSLAVNGMVLRPVVGAHLERHVDVLARRDSLAHARVREVLGVLRKLAVDTRSENI
ncbi:LysR family transcriptional regulator [Microbacterium sp. NPDC076768]|uniref:LysR family transcriptional regulator n=1 Tax=Microbacterium sp. NPDC076768 TaxID=3154858 RepID=UPI00343E8C57